MAPQGQAQDGQKDQAQAQGAPREQRHGGGGRGPGNRDHGRHQRPNAERQARPPQPQGARQEASSAQAKPDGAQQRPGGGGAQQQRGDQPHRRDSRPGDQGGGRDSRPPRHQDKKPYTATAAPRKSSAAIDPDFSFRRAQPA